MAEIVLFHHALGLTPGLVGIADELRARGHGVTTPDLFDGRVFDTIEAGVEHAAGIGFDTVTERGIAAARPLGHGFVVIGLSLGALPAQKLAQTDDRVAAAVLCHGAVPIAAFGSAWPDGVPVRIHLVEHDPFGAEDLEAARELAAAAADGELLLHPGTGHLVTDPSGPDHDPVVGPRIVEQVIDFVERVTSRHGA